MPFLDYLVTCDNSRLRTTIYRKLTKTDQSSYNPTSYKVTTIRRWARQAQLVCESPDSIQDETDYLNKVFSKNNYNTDFVTQTLTVTLTPTLRPTLTLAVFTTATIPYIHLFELRLLLRRMMHDPCFVAGGVLL